MAAQLVSRYYKYCSVNCDWMLKHSLYGRNFSINSFNISCCESPKEQTRNKADSLKYVALGVSLPAGAAYKFPHEDVPIWTFVHIISHVLVTANGDVISRNFKIVPQRCEQDLSLKVPSLKTAGDTKLHREVLTLSQYWGSGFFHGTLENLPRLASYVEFLNAHPDVKIHVAKKYRFLTQLGVIDIDKRIVTGNIRALVLYMPAGSPCGRSPLFTTQLLSQRLRASLAPRANLPEDAIVLIKRSQKRFFRNHDSILKLLQKYGDERGLRVAVYGDNPVPGEAETGELFDRALIVVAPHGAGESNLLLSRPGTILIEGLCYTSGKFANLCYRNMAVMLGLRYYGLLYKKDCFDITAADVEKPLREYLELYQKGLL